MKFYIMWANHTANHLWSKTLSSSEAGEVPIWDGAVDRTRFEHVAHRLITKYFCHPQYYRIDGKPVLMIYDINNLIRALGFDSVTNYQFVHIANVNRDYAQVFEDLQETWRDPVMTGNTPQEFKKAMEKAKEYVDLHDLSCPLITVNSWNEWTETSYLEPDDLYGYGYLEAIRDVILK